MEPKKRIELSSSAWKAEVLTIIQLRHMAGVEGLEPTSLVLETKAQPLYQTPIGWDGRARTSTCQVQSLMTYQFVYIPILVGVDGVAPPEFSQLIYSQSRYCLRYKLPIFVSSVSGRI